MNTKKVLAIKQPEVGPLIRELRLQTGLIKEQFTLLIRSHLSYRKSLGKLTF